VLHVVRRSIKFISGHALAGFLAVKSSVIVSASARPLGLERVWTLALWQLPHRVGECVRLTLCLGDLRRFYHQLLLLADRLWREISAAILSTRLRLSLHVILSRLLLDGVIFVFIMASAQPLSWSACGSDIFGNCPTG
jgi:hypothetical protein